MLIENIYSTKNISGIYLIKNKVNGKLYVGSAVNIHKRYLQHSRALKGGYHGNKKLANAVSKYGFESFVFSVLEITSTDKEALISTEQKWINVLNAVEAGYNILPIAGSSAGVKFSDDHKKKLSLAKKGKPRSDEAVAKTAEKNKGNQWNKGKVLSESTKQKISEALKGRRMSEAAKGKLIEVAKKRDLTKFHAAALKAQTGRKLSEETKKKMSEAHKKRRAHAY